MEIYQSLKRCLSFLKSCRKRFMGWNSCVKLANHVRLPKHFSHLFQKVKLALAFFSKSCIINLIEPTTPLVFHAQPGETFMGFSKIFRKSLFHHSYCLRISLFFSFRVLLHINLHSAILYFFNLGLVQYQHPL